MEEVVRSSIGNELEAFVGSADGQLVETTVGMVVGDKVGEPI